MESSLTIGSIQLSVHGLFQQVVFITAETAYIFIESRPNSLLGAMERMESNE